MSGGKNPATACQPVNTGRSVIQCNMVVVASCSGGAPQPHGQEDRIEPRDG